MPSSYGVRLKTIEDEERRVWSDQRYVFSSHLKMFIIQQQKKRQELFSRRILNKYLMY